MDAGARRRGLLLAAPWLTLAMACAPPVQRFPLAEPYWEDADRRPVGEEPSEYYSGLMADGADKMLFRPLARAAYLPLEERAHNVNALDEVPNSSWFTNRIGFHPMTPERAAQGACGDAPPLDPTKPWTVVAAKPNGANPGFFIKTDSGRYLLKFGGAVQPQRATASDIIGSKIYWAAGFNAPCNQIVYFHRAILRIADDAMAEDNVGKEHPITERDIDKVLAAAFRLPDGSLRAAASKFLPGKPIGPFRYEGKRPDDPNDHIPHQHRRELRGHRLLSAWLNHHDAREQNSLDIWVNEKDRSYVRHYMIDFGDILGGRWEIDSLTRRTGHAYFVDWGQGAVDYITLGAYPRPWYKNKMNPEAEIFGYYSTDFFVASEWKTDYPNPAFIETRYDDMLWMARIIARFTDAHIRAIVKQGKLTNKRAEEFLIRTMIGRRDISLREYLTAYAPLDRFRVVRRKPNSARQSVCFEDLAIRNGFVDPRVNVYKMRFYGGTELKDELGWLQFQPDLDHPDRACVMLPLGDRRPSDLVPRDAPDNHPLRYGVLKTWIHQRVGIRPTSSIHLHFYDLGPQRGYRLVGIERPDRPTLPDVYY